MIMTEPSVAASSSESPAGPVRISEMLLVCSVHSQDMGDTLF